MVVFVLVAAIAPAPVAAAPVVEQNETVIQAEFSNTVPVDRDDGSVYLWKSEPNTLTVTYQSSDKYELYNLCVQNETGVQVLCEDERVAPGDGTMSLDFGNLSAFQGSQNVTVVLWNNFPGESEMLGSHTINITIIEKDGDIDGDKLSNADELSNNTSMFLMDTDQDSLEDGAEVINYGTSPTSADTDNDGLSDAAELSRSLSPTDPDTDGDGLNDRLESRLGTDPTNSGTTPMLLFASVTLSGVVAVVARWIWPLWRHRLISSVPSRPETGPAFIGGESSDAPDPDESAISQEFDHAELQQSSQPVLTDEDRVVQLLRENDGWVYQSFIVEETSWSKSKVSRLLSQMADEGTIEKISIGRQNVVAEKGSMPDGFGSPFEEGGE
jgi:hypothetical protein